MKINKKIIALLTVSVVSVGAISPAFQTFADTVPASTISTDENFLKLYNTLSDDKKAEFVALVQENHLTADEQYKVLNDYVNKPPMPRWKLTVLKEAVKYAAKLVGAKIGEKTIADFVNYLTDFEDHIQDGLENGMVKYFHISRNTAHWAAKTVVFIFF
ncbi:hypothetical protein [Enterococcus faecium]|uniref:hypothetical protein n=1 Tax=Enterococcus faecium TaxID=1352 RepID=UPI000A32D98F|nr:hypothetical protein [Enterococcus faecium]OTO52012.1 hypothetical protein A5814_000095 [Enterococcus faecium]